MSRVPTAFALTLSLALGSGAPLLVAADDAAPRVVGRASRTVSGATYTFEKVLGPGGAVKETILRDGVPVDSVPHTAPPPLAHPRLQDRLAATPDDAIIAVNIALKTSDEAPEAVPAESGSFQFARGRLVSHVRNGEPVGSQAVAELDRVLEDNLRAQRQARIEEQRQRLKGFAERHGLGERREVQAALRDESPTLTIALSATEIRGLLAVPDADVAGIELFTPASNEITEAMADTGIAAQALPFISRRGLGIGIYQTEPSCPDETGRSNYDRLSGSQDNHSQWVFGVLRAVAPDSFIYCRSGSVLPLSSDLDGVGGNPAIRVINLSAGFDDSTSYSTSDRDWDDFVYANLVPIFKSAGNNGLGTGNVTAPGKGLSVMAVGNYDDATDTINGQSSFVNSEIGNQKPEIVAPGTNITAGGFIASGTSAAAPHAAAFVADMMSGWSVYLNRPEVVYAAMVGGASDDISGGVDKVGTGGIEFRTAYSSGWTFFYTGSNGSFETFDSQDGVDDGAIDTVVNVTDVSPRLRVGISWLNRGTYTYDHRTDAHPIGQDLDLFVVGPDGTSFGGSASFDNPFEVFEFQPTVPGNYHFKVNRFANRDTSASFRLGLRINAAN